MKKEFKEAIEDSPIIAAIKDDEGLKKCLTSESRVIFRDRFKFCVNVKN